jgi:hypothetical protein
MLPLFRAQFREKFTGSLHVCMAKGPRSLHERLAAAPGCEVGRKSAKGEAACP